MNKNALHPQTKGASLNLSIYQLRGALNHCSGKPPTEVFLPTSVHIIYHYYYYYVCLHNITDTYIRTIYTYVGAKHKASRK